MKYLIIGAGGTGGSIGAFMAEAGKDVTVIARGKHLEAVQTSGMRMETTSKGNYIVSALKAFDMEHYNDKPDVIFVCVKGYSLEDTIPFIQRIAQKETIVIPLLNLYGTGGKLQKLLPDLLVTDGCIYIAAEIKEPGTILQKADIFRVLFGVREAEKYSSALEQIAQDLRESGIAGMVSEDIRRDALQKFSYVSAMAACGAYYHSNAGDAQKNGTVRDSFVSLMSEINELAKAMNIHFTVDIVKTNLEILDKLTPEASTSMQRDLEQGKNSEIDGLVFEVVRLGRKLEVPVPCYEAIAAKLGFIE